jgi:MFS family permease
MGRPQYEAARFFMGFGNSMAQLSCPMLLTEIAHPQHRARITTVYNCLWNVGALICGWLAFGTAHIAGNWSWRLPTLIQGIFSVIQLTFIWWIPEYVHRQNFQCSLTNTMLTPQITKIPDFEG